MSEQTPNYKTEVTQTANFWRENPHHILAHNAANTLEKLTAEAFEAGRRSTLADIALQSTGVVINDIGVIDNYNVDFDPLDKGQGVLDYDETNGQTRLEMKETA